MTDLEWDAIRDVSLYTGIDEDTVRIVIDRLKLDPDSADLFDPDRASRAEYDILSEKCDALDEQKYELERLLVRTADFIEEMIKDIKCGESFTGLKYYEDRLKELKGDIPA